MEKVGSVISRGSGLLRRPVLYAVSLEGNPTWLLAKERPALLPLAELLAGLGLSKQVASFPLTQVSFQKERKREKKCKWDALKERATAPKLSRH